MAGLRAAGKARLRRSKSRGRRSRRATRFRRLRLSQPNLPFRRRVGNPPGPCVSCRGCCYRPRLPGRPCKPPEPEGPAVIYDEADRYLLRAGSTFFRIAYFPLGLPVYGPGPVVGVWPSARDADSVGGPRNGCGQTTVAVRVAFAGRAFPFVHSQDAQIPGEPVPRSTIRRQARTLAPPCGPNPRPENGDLPRVEPAGGLS